MADETIPEQDAKAEEDVWLVFDEVMTRLNLKRPEIYRQVKDGKLKAEKKDGVLRFNEKLVAEFDEKRKSEETTLLDAVDKWEKALLERFPMPPAEPEDSKADLEDVQAQKESEQTEAPLPADNQADILPETPPEEEAPKEEPKVDVAARVKGLVELFLSSGIREGVTDLYFDPVSTGDRVLFRYGEALVDLGLTEGCLSLPMRKVFKEMGKLVTEGDAQKRKGIAELKVNDIVNQFMIEVAPTRLGEHIHVHFWGADAVKDLCSLGYTEAQKDQMIDALKATTGFILLARGVSSFDDLHHVALGRLLANHNLVVSCESGMFPKSEHLVQVAVDTKHEKGLAQALDAALSLEPDVLMVDMVNTPEELKALFSALTYGGIVIAGVRALDYADITRIFEKAEISSELLNRWVTCGVERVLVRELCPDCKTPRPMNETERAYWQIDESAQVFDPVGCACCQDGFLGLRGIFGFLQLPETQTLGVPHVVRQCLLNGVITQSDAKQIYGRFATQ